MNSAHKLNQYTSRDVPGAMDIMGLSIATNGVVVSAAELLHHRLIWPPSTSALVANHDT
jgi:hypothetical protein